MRILVHDYAGHPFQVQLSRELARRGHAVLHLYCASLQTTPQARLQPREDDPPAFEIEGIHLAKPLDKFNLLTRWKQEREYGRLLAQRVPAFRPEAVLSANTPLDAQRALLRASHEGEARFIYWAQDLLGPATRRLLSGKSRFLGAAVGGYYTKMERALLQASDGVVAITDDFRQTLRRWQVDEKKIHVVENWAPLGELPLRLKDNAWSQAHGLADKVCLLYAGTLGMKHDPDLLLQLALHFRQNPRVRVAVLSQGRGADWLKARKEEHGLSNLLVLDFQPFERMPDVLASADVLLAVLEPDAGVFSVPSKVLTYLCAARPLLLAVPPENLAARIVAEHGCGCVVSPTDMDAFIRAADDLIRSPEKRERMGRHARAYAEKTFDIAAKANAFEQILIS